MGKASILLDSLVYFYGSSRAVDGVSFSVSKGEIFGLLGPNGAGKSTTIKMLIGRLIPQSGSITILGIPVSGYSREVHRRMGVCFEEKNLYEQLSGEENLSFFADLFSIKGLDIAARLEEVDLHTRGKDRVSSYSKGMRQRLMMARALINDPEVLFLDEPTDGLDPVSARTIRSIIKARAEAGAAVLLTTHDMHEADELSHRVAFINEGSIIAQDAPEKLKLRFGSRSLKVRLRSPQGITESEISLDRPEFPSALQGAVNSGEIVTMHTQEATLEDVFIAMTGRRLS